MFDFFFRVNSKLVRDIKIPFKLEGETRIDDTPVHKALREALANCLVNADFYVPRGVVIKKEQEGWKEPEVEEQYGPDRTILTLPLVKKQAKKTSEIKRAK